MQVCVSKGVSAWGTVHELAFEPCLAVSVAVLARHLWTPAPWNLVLELKPRHLLMITSTSLIDNINNSLLWIRQYEVWNATDACERLQGLENGQ
jgi:hypothetical protein